MKHEKIDAALGLGLLLALPWLNPITHGPSHSMVQWLSTWMAGAIAALSCLQARLPGAAVVRMVALSWLLAACLSACLGLLQYFGIAEALGPWLFNGEPGQAFGNLRQRNQQATLLAIGLCALVWWQAQPKTDPQPADRPPAQPLARLSMAVRIHGPIALAAGLLAAAAAASGSRTGMLQLFLLLAVALCWQRARATLLWVLLVYAAAAILLPKLAGLEPLHSGILGRLGEPASPCASRLTLWSNVLHLIAQKPWVGWGWGQLGYAHFVTLYPGARFCEIMGNAHNLPLHLAVELGVPVAVLLCGAALWLVARARPWRAQDATRQMAWSVLLVIGAHSLLEYPLWYGPFQLAALMAVWILWPTRAAQALPAHGAARRLPAQAAISLAALVLGVCSYLAWDYWRISQIYLSPNQRAPAYREDTLQKIRPSRVFASEVKFAELGTTPLSAENAQYIHALALELLHFSPEASVAGKLIASAEMLGLSQEAQAYRLRFQAAYPKEYAAWQARRPDSGSADKVP